MYRLIAGRMNRSTYLLVNLTALLFVIVLSRPDIANYIDTHESTGALVGLVLGIPLLTWQLTASARRFHDVDLPGWYALLIIIPFVQTIMLFWPGTKGDNRYGPAHTQTFDLGNAVLGPRYR